MASRGLPVYAWRMATGRRPLTQELYETLTQAYRESPGNASYAAQRALCDRRLAKRLWDGPAYKDYPWARRIKEVLTAEKLEAQQRAMAASRHAMEAAEAGREKARREAEEARGQERQMLRAARGDVLAALAIAAELVPAMRVVARSIAEAVKPKPDGSPPDIPPLTAMTLLSRHAQLVQRAIGATEAVVQLSRLERGTLAGAADKEAPEDMSLADALEELETLGPTLLAGRAALAAGARGAPEH